MRLYRGLSKSYRPEMVGVAQGPMFGTNFTDCPFAALSFARGSRGVVIVLDVPDVGPSAKVSQELWLASGPRRLMVWGKFDRHIAAIIPAKDLRARIRQKGVAGTSDKYKPDILRALIEQWIAERVRHHLDASA